MIGRLQVQKFPVFSLYVRLFCRGLSFSTSSVYTYLLIFSPILSLSTVLVFGAKLLSLYLFLAKKRGKLTSFPVIYE